MGINVRVFGVFVVELLAQALDVLLRHAQAIAEHFDFPGFDHLAVEFARRRAAQWLIGCCLVVLTSAHLVVGGNIQCIR